MPVALALDRHAGSYAQSLHQVSSNKETIVNANQSQKEAPGPAGAIARRRTAVPPPSRCAAAPTPGWPPPDRPAPAARPRSASSAARSPVSEGMSTGARLAAMAVVPGCLMPAGTVSSDRRTCDCSMCGALRGPLRAPPSYRRWASTVPGTPPPRVYGHAADGAEDACMHAAVCMHAATPARRRTAPRQAPDDGASI